MNTTNDVYVISMDAVDLNLLPISQTHRDGGTVPLWSKSNLDSRRNEYYEFVIKSDDTKEGQNEPVIENVTCHICDINVPKVYLNEHKNSFRHKFNRKVADTALRRLQLYMNNEDINEFNEKLPTKHFCTECSIVIDSEDKTSHKQTTGHRNSLFLERFLNDFLNFYTNDDTEIRKDDTRKDITMEVIKESKNSKQDFVSEKPNITKTVLKNTKKGSTETEDVKETKDDENSKTNQNSDERNVNSSSSCDLQKDEVIFQVANGSKVNTFKDTGSYYDAIVEISPTSGYCMICNHMYLQENRSLHARSDIHNQNLHKKPLDMNCVRKINNALHHCALCNDYFTEYDLHVISKEHLTNFRNMIINECDKTVQDNDNCNKDKKDDNSTKYSDVINSNENKSSTSTNKDITPVNKDTSESLATNTSLSVPIHPTQDNDNCNKDKKDDNSTTYSDFINSNENKSSTSTNKDIAPVNKDTSESLATNTSPSGPIHPTQDNDNCNKDKKDDNSKKYSDVSKSDENKSSTITNKDTAPVNKDTSDSPATNTSPSVPIHPTQDNDNCNKDKKDDNSEKYSDVSKSDENKSSTSTNKNIAPVNKETSDSLATNTNPSVPIHPTLFCNTCNVWISPNQVNKHKNTFKHNFNEMSDYHYLMKCLDEENLFCRICSVNVSNFIEDITEHFTSARHVKMYNQLLKDHGITKRYYKKYYCRECKVYMLHKNEYLHIISKKHTDKVGFSEKGEIDKQCDDITRSANGDATVALVDNNTGGGGSGNATDNVQVNANNDTALETIKQLDSNPVNINPALRKNLLNLSTACTEWLTKVKEVRKSNTNPTKNVITALDNENTLENKYICDVCKVEVPNNDNNIAEHNRGRPHRLKLGTYIPQY